MKTNKLTAPLLLLFTFFSGVTGVPAEKPYEGDIREDDLRVEELRSQILNQDSEIPAMRLRYSGTTRNYAVFYDLTGKVIYYKYRTDRFDDRGNRKIEKLIEGQAYRVEGSFLGCELNLVMYKQESESFSNVSKDQNCFLVFTFESAYPLRMEQILFP